MISYGINFCLFLYQSIFISIFFLFFSGIVWAVRSKPNTMNKPERNVNFICKCIQAGQLETITLKVKRKSAKESLKQVRYRDSQLFLHFHSWNGPIWESMTDPESHVISLTSWQNHSYKSFQIFEIPINDPTHFSANFCLTSDLSELFWRHKNGIYDWVNQLRTPFNLGLYFNL